MSHGMETIKTVWTNGCFDVLHRGHLELFKFAQSFGERLIVGVDTDDRVRGSKGPERPYNNLQDRVAMLKAIRFIDEVKVFGTDAELEDQIVLCDAKIIVIGSDYKNKKIIGKNLVDKIIFYDRISKYSTTKILNGL